MQLIKKTNFSPSWQELYRDSIRSTKELFDELGESKAQEIVFSSLIPRSFAKKIKNAKKDSPLWKQFVPSIEENIANQGFFDPIGDQKYNKAPGIIHRYTNRILFTPTNICPVSCRYCFRKNELEDKENFFKTSLRTLDTYLSSHTEINEVILTGGDPLIITDKKIEDIFQILLKNKIKFVRFHTRTPIILPQRITDDFIKLLTTYQSQFTRIVFVLHTNHSDEIDYEVKTALEKLKSLDIERLTQSVLLKGVNDTPSDLVELFSRIIDCGMKPYYLHHPDQVKGAMHFYLSLETGRVLYNQLRDKLSGWMLPHYIIDPPDGRGKQLAFNPETIKFSGNLLDRFEVTHKYPIPKLDN